MSNITMTSYSSSLFLPAAQVLKPVKRVSPSLEDTSTNKVRVVKREAEQTLEGDSMPAKTIKIETPNGMSVKVKTSAVKKISDKVKNKLEKIAVQKDGTIRPFNEIEISTKTAVVITNCCIDLEKFYKYIPITDFEPPIKKRGRKPSSLVEKKAPKLPIGAVPRVQYEHRIRGCHNLKQRAESTSVKVEKPSNDDASSPAQNDSEKDVETVEEDIPDPTGKAKKKMSYFLHCVVIDVAIDNQADELQQNFKNVKVYANGKFHITGCKNDEQYIETVRSIFRLFGTIEDYTNEKVVDCKDATYKAVFNTVMKNMDFYIGFNIFRNKLDEFINHSDMQNSKQNNMQDFKSIFEGSLNTGVNIKIPIQKFDEILMAIEYNQHQDKVKKTYVNYNDYKQYFARKGNKEPAHTFLVFATGHVIFTSCGPEMEQMYYRCISLLINNRKYFEETETKAVKV